MTPEQRQEIMSMSYDDKKELLISWLEEAGELGEGIDWSDMTEETINQIFDVLFMESETERDEIINKYLEKERRLAKEHHDNLMEIISQIQKFNLKVKERESSQSDEKDISSLEDKVLNL